MIGRTQNSALTSPGLNAPKLLHCNSYALLHLTCELEEMLFIVSTPVLCFKRRQVCVCSQILGTLISIPRIFLLHIFFSLGIECWTWCRNLTLLHIKSQASVRNVTKADGERDYNTSESFRLEEIIVSFVLNECQKSTNWLKDGKESILE